MASGSYQQCGNWRTACGRLRRYYVKADGLTKGSARDAATLAALIARVQARKPGAALVVISFENGARTERPVVEETTTLAGRAA